MQGALEPQPATRWLIKGRLLTLALLLGSELGARHFVSNPLPARLFVAIMLAWALLPTALPLTVGKVLPASPATFLQILFDLVFVTLIVHVTGGVDSSLNLLYPLVILCAAVILPRGWVYLTAALAFILYGALLELVYFTLLPSYSSTTPQLGTLQAVIFLNLFGFLGVAYLASRLAAKLRHANDEFHRLERELRIQDRVAAVGRLASAMAHEIRNPLTSIAGSAHMLSQNTSLADEHRQLLHIIVRESQRLNKLLTEFLDYSRERRYSFAPADLVRLLDETLALLPTRADQCRVSIQRQYTVGCAWTLGDGDKLRQVIWNLCDNALRAMPQGGRLRVSLQCDQAYWVLTFADNGPGMPVDLVESIFEPFQSGFPGGTGLGLAIVYQIMQAHHGEISVRSAPRQGSEFTLRVRRLQTDAAAARAAALTSVEA